MNLISMTSHFILRLFVRSDRVAHVSISLHIRCGIYTTILDFRSTIILLYWQETSHTFY
jgi:hypothetical protein